jgi:hypothetical protein
VVAFTADFGAMKRSTFELINQIDKNVSFAFDLATAEVLNNGIGFGRRPQDAEACRLECQTEKFDFHLKRFECIKKRIEQANHTNVK